MKKNNENTDVAISSPLTTSGVERMIQVVRGKQVLLDRDLATLYGVETRAINQAVKRNAERFPERYRFQLTADELQNLKSQNVISSWDGDRFKPYVSIVFPMSRQKFLEQDRKNAEYDRRLDEVFEAMDRNELKSKGLFYNNQEFDAYVFVCNLIRQAKKKIVLVDNYVNEKTLAMMLKRSTRIVPLKFYPVMESMIDSYL